MFVVQTVSMFERAQLASTASMESVLIIMLQSVKVSIKLTVVRSYSPGPIPPNTILVVKFIKLSVITRNGAYIFRLKTKPEMNVERELTTQFSRGLR